MSIVEKTIDFFFGKVADTIFSKTNTRIENEQLKKRIEKYSKKYFDDVFYNISISDEFDFGGLNDFLYTNLHSKVAVCFNAANYNDRQRFLDELFNQAYKHAQADSNENKNTVGLYVANILNVIKQFYLEKVDGKDIFLAGLNTDQIIAEINNARINIETRMNEFDRQLHDLTTLEENALARLCFPFEENVINEYIVPELVPYVSRKNCKITLIIGSGGAGKTSWLKCRQGILSLSDTWPIYVPLNRTTGYCEHPISKYVCMAIGSKVLNPYQSLRALIEKSKKKFVFLLDGINECDQGRTKSIYGEINDLMSIRNIEHIYITARSKEALRSGIEDRDYQVYKTNPLAENVIRNYLTGHLVDTSAITHSLFRLLKNPMLLTMFAQTYDSSYSGSEESRFIEYVAEIIEYYYDEQLRRKKLRASTTIRDYHIQHLVVKLVLPLVAATYFHENHTALEITLIDFIAMLNAVRERISNKYINWNYDETNCPRGTINNKEMNESYHDRVLNVLSSFNLGSVDSRY